MSDIEKLKPEWSGFRYDVFRQLSNLPFEVPANTFEKADGLQYECLELCFATYKLRWFLKGFNEASIARPFCESCPEDVIF